MEKYSLDSIKDQVCVITGGCGVLGSKMAAALLEVGAKVAILDFRDDVKECAEKIAVEHNGEAFGIFTNVLEKDSLISARDEVNEKFGKIDVLINCAGGNAPTGTTSVEKITDDMMDDLSGTFFGLDIEGFRRVSELNFLGTVLPSMVFGEDMLQRGGSIINISSMSAYKALTKVAAYSAAKASVSNFTEWLAVHFGKMNVRVNSIAPGFFLTAQNKFLLTDKETGKLTPRGHKIIGATPMGRFGEPEDLIGTLLFLISDQSKFITGIIIPVDGGFNADAGV